ncbi:MAG: zinc ribbon domain-containing protein [Anaerolineales bacterium]|jgi:hypothetical protein
MDIGSILLLLALVIVVAAFIASPLRADQRRRAVGEEDIELSQLLAERERVLEALAELDFDNEMGKVPDDLYPVQREALLKRGADVLRLLDDRMPSANGSSAGEADRAAQLERAASIRHAQDDPLEAMIATRRKERTQRAAKTEVSSSFCPNCGEALEPDDRFCAACGEEI